MSRSYKKTPGYTQNNRWFKHYANKAVRRVKNVPNGKAYRKCFNSYSICDHRSMYYNGRAEVLRRDVIKYARHYHAPWRAWMK